jgi:phosphatidylinositol alpha-mannosyltransferase
MPKNPSLKVGLVFDDTLDSTDGVAQYVKTLGAWLSDQGHQVHYLVGETRLSEWHGGRIHSLAQNVQVRFNGNRLSMPLPAKSAPIDKLLKRHEFDVLHIMAPYSPFMGKKVIQRAPPGTAVIATFHIYPAGRLAVFGSRLLRLALAGSLKRVDSFISVSPVAARFAKDTYRISSQIIPNPVSLNYYKTSHQRRDDSKQRIVFLGRLVPRKGAEQLIRAFNELYKTRPNVELIIAGDGPERAKLDKLVRRFALGNVVEFLGRISEQRKPELLASADIACFPSLYGESFGIVLVEAMAAGAKVVLGGNNPGYRSVLGKQPQLLIDPDDTPEFARRLAVLLDDKTLAAKLSSWQRQHVKAFDIETVGQQIVTVYNGQIALKRKNSNN